MKIFWFFLGGFFAFAIGTISAHSYPGEGVIGSTERGLEKGNIVLAQAKSTPADKESGRYQKKAEETINEFKGKLRELQAKAKNLNEKAKEEAKNGMDELQKKLDAAELKVKAIRSASGEAWEKLKAEVDSSLESVRETYRKTVARFHQ
jgi:hypothetical protein